MVCVQTVPNIRVVECQRSEFTNSRNVLLDCRMFTISLSGNEVSNLVYLKFKLSGFDVLSYKLQITSYQCLEFELPSFDVTSYRARCSNCRVHCLILRNSFLFLNVGFTNKPVSKHMFLSVRRLRLWI